MHVVSGHRVATVSAGLDLYLRFLMVDQPSVVVIASRPRWKKGRWWGIHDFCYGDRKRALVTKHPAMTNADWSKSFAYSDHVSDLPIISLVGNPVVVTSGGDVPWRKSTWRLMAAPLG
jgi:phosphoserine phosphatase